MPRRRPARLRAHLPIRQGPGPLVRQISRVSASTSRAIAELERARLQPGDIAGALDGWARFVRGPRRSLNDDAYPSELCPCSSCQRDHPVELRQTLHTALHALPTKAARELRALVQPLDETYLARSIPHPDSAHLRDLLTITPARTKFCPDPPHTAFKTATSRRQQP